MLEPLYQRFKTLSYMDISSSQKFELRGGLMMVKPSEITSTQDAQRFMSLLRMLRESIIKDDELHGQNYPQLLNSLLSVGEDGLYSNNLRFVFELIQNVDDCEFADLNDHTLDIHFDFNHDKIVLRYNEKGFTPFNVFAITGIAETAKNIQAGKNEIGEKGIGFKSVFGVADAVLIRSGWFSFELYKENFTVPVARYQDVEYHPGTEMTLSISGGKTRGIYNEIKKQYCNKDALFSRNPLLFLNKLTTLKMYYDGFRTMEFHVSRENCPISSKFFKEENVHISVNLHDYDNGSEKNVVEEIRCTRYWHNVVFSEDACKSRYGDKTKVGSNGGKPMSLQVVLPYPEYLESVGNGALYSFLPTQLRFNVPMVCHVPFKLDASREFVDPQENNIWFKDSVQYLSELLDHAYQDWAKEIKNEVVAYLPGVSKSLFADNNGKEKCLSLERVFKGEHFLKLPIFYTVNDHFVDIDSIFCFDRHEKIFEPKQAYQFLSLSRELFLLPQRSSLPDIGIKTERNVYHRLFAIALAEQTKTEEVLQYLIEAEFFPDENAIPENEFELTERQIVLLMRDKRFSRIFIEHAKKCLKKQRRPFYKIRAFSAASIRDVLYQDFNPTEAPKIVERYLGWCQEKCVLSDIGQDQYLPCHNALVLSAANPLSSFAAFCYEIDSSDTFSIRMKHKEISARLNQLSESNEGSADDFLRELRNQRLLGRDALGPKQYQSYIELILRSGASQTRFIQELLQNADDCDYPEDAVPQFSLTQSKSKIVTEYNEVGFTRGNIRSITSIGESTKNLIINQQVAQIGEKGVGFKTIFAIASSVQIHSGMYHFLLRSNTPTIPELLEHSSEVIRGTRMEIELKEGRFSSVYSEREILELCLCLRKLRKIQINNTDVTIEDIGNLRTITINKRQHTFRSFTHDFSMDDEALRERENGLRRISKDQRIVCYIPDKGAAKDYPLYCGLPTKHRIRIPLVIDAPFMLTTSREEIELSSCLWNNRIRDEMYKTLLSIMDEQKYSDRSKVLRFVRFVPRRQGALTVYTNDVSDCEYLNKYDFLSKVRELNLLPTFDKQVFVSAQSGSAFRFPEAANWLFSSGHCGSVPTETALDIPQDESSDSILNAMKCSEAPFKDTFPLLQEYAEKFIGNDTFRQKLYDCLQYAPEEYQPLLQKLAILPVYSVLSGHTEYISWQDDGIFVKKNCIKSERNYRVLNEKILPKSICEQILGVNINEMNTEYERICYSDELMQIVSGSNTAAIYQYLLKEFAAGSFERYQLQEILMGMKDILPLKNQLGKIVDTGVFICGEPTGYFQSPTLLAMSVHDECKKLAEYLRYPALSDIHYENIPYVDMLTTDDMDDFTDDYFKNGEEIIRHFYRDGKISDDLIAQYDLQYIVMQYSQDNECDECWEFPQRPVKDLKKLREHVRTMVRDPIEIVPVKVERTVYRGKDSMGKEFGIDDRDVRNQTLSMYTPDGVHGHCFCQMCHKLKPYDFMEVNNILKSPKYFFPQTRVALCLECSKKFEAMRHSNAQKSRLGKENAFFEDILQADIGAEGCVDVMFGNESIRFTATHIAEIQEIFSSLPGIRSEKSK